MKKRLESLEAYTPGEQPQDKKYIKLNTNESPFPPDEYVISKAKDAAAGFNVYNDPECSRLREKAADFRYAINRDIIERIHRPVSAYNPQNHRYYDTYNLHHFSLFVLSYPLLLFFVDLFSTIFLSYPLYLYSSQLIMKGVGYEKRVIIYFIIKIE